MKAIIVVKTIIIMPKMTSPCKTINCSIKTSKFMTSEQRLVVPFCLYIKDVLKAIVYGNTRSTGPSANLIKSLKLFKYFEQ